MEGVNSVKPKNEEVLEHTTSEDTKHPLQDKATTSPEASSQLDAGCEQSASPSSSNSASDTSTPSDKTPPSAAGDGLGTKPKKKGSGKKKMKGPSLSEIKKQGRLKKQQKTPGGGDVEILGDMSALALEEPRPILPSKGTGLIYDERMLQHRNLWDPRYPENPERIRSPYKRCLDYGLVERCVRLEAKTAEEKDILLQHSQGYIDILKTSMDMNKEELRELAETKFEDVVFNNTPEDGMLKTPAQQKAYAIGKSLHQLRELATTFHSAYFTDKTFECAQLSLGSTMTLTEEVVMGNLKNGFAIVRPPGHHAMKSEACGYCFFNNVAIAAKHAVENLGLERVLIVDWDVHHGQGTQYMFYDDPRVLYFSIHRYENGHFWPNLRESDYDYIGEGRGKGFNINAPLNRIGLGNSDYLALFQQILMPIAYEFNPQLVLVSSGYDAAIGCPEFCPQLVLVSAGYDSAVGDEKGEMEVTPSFYAHLTHMLSSLADGKVCVILEGGYCIKSLSEGVALTLRELLADPCPQLEPMSPPSDSIIKTILNLLTVLRPHWKCLQYQESYPVKALISEVPTNSEELPPHFMTPDRRPEREPIEDCYPVQDPEIQAELSRRIDELINNTNLERAPTRTCYVYDEKMRKHKNAVDPGHPERPDRITRIHNRHKESGLLDRCTSVKSRIATEEELALCHSCEYIQEVKETKSTKPRDLKDIQCKYNSIYLCQDSFDCALLAVGSLLNVTDRVVTGQSQNGVAVIRPPGHHAEVHTACGFCFFNNVPIAAKYAQKKYGVKRILILDWDVHHGNGIQHIFEDDPSVLYISLHRYDYGFFFPSSTDADYDKVGTGAGEGFNVNIPWNRRGMGDAEYIAAFQQIVMPIAYEFGPELVFVSAGFDAARGDPLGGCDITPDGYAHLTHMLTTLANGKVIIALEGGYNLNSISESMSLCTSVLLGDPCPGLPSLTPCESAVISICKVLDVHRKYWKALQFRVPLPAVQPTKDKQESNREEDSPDKAGKTSPTLQTTVDELIQEVAGLSVNTPLLSDATPEELPAEGAIVPDEGACGGSDSPVDKSILEYLGDAVAGVEDISMHAVIPLNWCPHLETIQSLPSDGIDVSVPCMDCGTTRENWICLVCYEVHCGRYVNEHMLFHGIETEHRLVLSFADLSVWCYGCDQYVHNEILLPAKRAAHISKFGEDIPGGMM